MKEQQGSVIEVWYWLLTQTHQLKTFFMEGQLKWCVAFPEIGKESGACGLYSNDWNSYKWVVIFWYQNRSYWGVLSSMFLFFSLRFFLLIIKLCGLRILTHCFPSNHVLSATNKPPQESIAKMSAEASYSAFRWPWGLWIEVVGFFLFNFTSPDSIFSYILSVGLFVWSTFGNTFYMKAVVTLILLSKEWIYLFFFFFFR